ncbi:hypothetical protein PLESTB_001405800 [Pleodorina starrii]|uniref:Uncharacterized protein n=1 Tax=Pleodorina starrii TaxID=330485 RepID=A0A9W6F7S3_9CHLO|nr:hypothetical protein PLESTM_000943700 [Pleodorina starrii]GLC58831.1 hypothetical protein PLESTB_001405800 [Pleodorina starrii]GLC68014.1 hypothetical protein PLESTF_000635700 [Pleodorina starrii]
MDGASQAPFPILPAAIQICSILGAIYPHVDIIDDKIVVQTGRLQLDQTLHALSLGSCFLLLGFYCCQFLPALAPLRREYLGALGIMQMGHFLIMLARAAVFPASLRADPAGAVLGLLAVAGVYVVVTSDNVAYPNSDVAPEPKVAARARMAVSVATHGLWLVFALMFTLPYLSSLLPMGVPSQMPYGSVAALLTQVTAITRLGVFVSGRLAAARLAKHKAD